MNKYWPETEKPDESKSTIKFNLFEVEEEGSKTRNWKVKKKGFFHYLYLSFFNSRVSWLFLILCFSVSRKFAFKFTTFSCCQDFWIFWSHGVELWAKKWASFWVPVTYAILIWFVIFIAPRSPNKALKFNSPHALSTHCNPTPKTLSFQNFRDSSPTHLSRFLLHTKFLENRLELEFSLSLFRVFDSVFSKSLMLSILSIFFRWNFHFNSVWSSRLLILNKNWCENCFCF